MDELGKVRRVLAKLDPTAPHEVLQVIDGGIGDQKVDILRLGRLQRIEHHRRRIGVLALRHHGDAVALAPGFQLFHGSGAEGIAGGQHHLLAFVQIAPRELSYRRGLADAVDADGEDHERFGAAVDVERFAHGNQQRDQFPAQRVQQRPRIGELARLHPASQVVHDRRGRRHAHIRRDERGFDLVEEVLIELRVARKQRGKAARQRAVAQAFAPGCGGALRRFRQGCVLYGFRRRLRDCPGPGFRGGFASFPRVLIGGIWLLAEQLEHRG